ncbi:uncharacterized protein LOC129951039 [Eupeodes corollae]|uniref:uncharacterized protein LOC129951039 n=1 Tax=Eupeodes corollae TaxID=290404 RepID=UPI00248FA9F9|nr:uncharacterized protein LOC129951039 [Eupeodes corollae]
MKKVLTLCLVSMLYLTLPHYSQCQQPPYQVSIILKMPGNFQNPHLCNGVIIHEKLILTTADCMHFKFGMTGPSNKLEASAINVIAGSKTAQQDVIQMNVSSIELPTNFEPTTLENDLALLTLSEALPLETRFDIRWIMIDDNTHVNRSCLVNFYTRNPNDAITDYYQTEELYTVNNDVCRNFTKYPAARKRDICSFYVLPHQYDCIKADSYLSFNNDRGTALVCKNFLVGLLSSVVTRPNPVNNCSDVVLRAIYSNIIPHLRWIYSVMSKMETQYISTPYDASVKPLMAIPNSAANITNTSQTASNSTILSNTTVSGFPFTNLTIPRNTSILNSTQHNSTYPNSTILNYATPHPLAFNSTKWNTTSIGNPSRNQTTKPVLFNNGVSTGPVHSYGTSIDPHIKHPTPKPAVQNIFTNSGVLAKLSAGSLLILLAYFRLITFYL